jgi:hypothetical protein
MFRPRLGDPPATSIVRIARGADALGRRRRESDQLDHQLDREAVREHDRFGAAVAARGEQFERAAAVGLGVALAAYRLRQASHIATLPSLSLMLK